MFAVFEVSGNQYRAQEGDKVMVEKLDHNVGDKIELDRVLMLGNGDSVTVGKPTVAGAKVLATVAEQSKGQKVVIFQYRIGGKRHRTNDSHRQNYTWLQIEQIVGE
jgi:large subunit ribosomal protein L21